MSQNLTDEEIEVMSALFKRLDAEVLWKIAAAFMVAGIRK